MVESGVKLCCDRKLSVNISIVIFSSVVLFLSR